MTEQNISKITAEGFLFRSEEDAALARQEKAKAEYLDAHLDKRNAAAVLQIYKRAIEERIFKTPVGLQYLKELQAIIRKSPQIAESDIPPIPLHVTYSVQMRSSYDSPKRRIQSREKKKPGWPLISLFVNLVLGFAVAAMFVITLKSDNPNILNYEANLVNKYASWEQELTQRERVVREKERELGITDNIQE